MTRSLPGVGGWAARVAAVVLAGLVAALTVGAAPAAASPGLCVGPVCGDQFSRPAAYPWQLRLRLQDQLGHRERLVVDCRDGSVSPLVGPVERGHAAAVGRKACRMAPLTPP
ncbi:MAG: hypothetical protein VKP63_09830 [Cyanobacteriota bacterium]|nr:hypothetical protein [Cyanobacteriota bacterium]